MDILLKTNGKTLTGLSGNSFNMKRLLILTLLTLAGYFVQAQSVGYMRYDTVKIYKEGGTAELVLINKTKDTLGFLTNIGGGRTKYVRVRQLDSFTIAIPGIDTFHIGHGSGGGGSGVTTVGTYSGTSTPNVASIASTTITIHQGDATNPGAVKLYNTTGSNTDGAVTQGAINTALALKAPLASPTFTGTPAAPTAAPGTNTTQLATTAFVTAAVVGGGSGATTVGSPNATSTANGADISSTTLTLHYGDGSNPGIMKLYTSTGTSTDGTMDRNSINTALALKTPNTRQIINGDGILGGGDFSADRTLRIDSAKYLTKLAQKKTTDSLLALISAGSGISNKDTTLNAGNGIGTQLGVNPNIVNSANYFNNGFQFNNSSYASGTSITFGLLAESYWNIINRQIGNNVLPNYGVSSTALRTAAYYISKNIGLNIQGASISDATFNDARWGFTATAGLDSTHLFPMIRAGNRWLTAVQLTDTVQFYRVAAGTVNPNASTSGSAVTALVADTLQDLCSRAQKFGTNIWWKTSITANETLTFANVKGRNIIAGVWADSIGGSRIEVRVDGVLITTYDPNQRCVRTDLEAPTGFHRMGIMNDAIVMTGFSDTLHVVQFKFLDAGTYGGVDWVGNLKEPSRAAFAPIYVPDLQHMTTSGYAVTGGSAVVQDSVTAMRWRDLILNFPGYYASIVRVFVNTNFTPTTHTVDGIHPNSAGYNIWANNITAAMNPKAIPNNAVSGTTSVTAPLDLGGYITTDFGIRQGDLVAQSSSVATNFWGWNVKVAGGVYKRIRADLASAYNHFSNGGLGLSVAPTGTAGSSITWTYPHYVSPDGNVQLGNNVSFTPKAWVDIAPATSAFASMNISNGSTPSSPQDGDIWKTSGHFFVRDGGTSKDLLATAGAPTAPLDLGGDFTGGFGLRQGSFIIQSNDASNVFFGRNAQIVSGAYQYYANGSATSYPMFSDGSTAIAVAASGTAGGAITWKYPAYFQVNGQVQLGSSVSFTPTAWVETPASTSTFASFKMPHGTAPSSPNNGEMWTTTTGIFARINGATKQLNDQYTNPLTTTGDIIYSSSGSTAARRGIGSTGDVLTVSGGVPAWASSSTLSYSGIVNTVVVAPGNSATTTPAYTTANDGVNHWYSLAPVVEVTACSSCVLTTAVSFTDNNNNSRTVTFFAQGATSAPMVAIGTSGFSPITIQAKSNTAITFNYTFAGVSILYDASQIITLLH